MIKPLASFNEVKVLLKECGLLTEDIPPAKPPAFFGIYSDGSLSAVIGLELFGDAALLRSLAVLPANRGKGLAQELVSYAENYALSQNIQSLFLLTETAESFFQKIGYRTAVRSDAPQAIKATSQFSGLCPASSSFLTKQLG